MPITYNSSTNITTLEFISGDSKGNESNPWGFYDIVDAHISNGWGKAHSDGFNVYIQSAIYIKGINTWFVDKTKNIEFSTLLNGQQAFNAYNGAHLRLGSLDSFFNLVEKDRVDGDSGYRWFDVTSADAEFINCHLVEFRCRVGDVAGNVVFKYSLFGVYSTFGISENVSLIGNTFYKGSVTCNVPLKEFTGNKFIGESFIYTNYLQECTIENTNLNENELSYSFRALLLGGLNKHFYLIDCMLTTAINTASSIAYDESQYFIHKQTMFKALLDEQANLSILDKDGNTIFSEFGSNIEGILDYEIVQLYSPSNDNTVFQLSNVYQPFTLIAEKPGHQTLEIPNITVTPGEPTIIRGAMVKKEPLAEDLDLSIGVELDSDIQIGVDLQPIEIGVEI